jgi:hypothetical protein
MPQQEGEAQMCSTADELLKDLTTRQHVRPHRPLRDALDDLCRATGACPAAAARATAWLNLSPDKPIGRLRRTELTQLARSIHRFWSATNRGEPAVTARPSPAL